VRNGKERDWRRALFPFYELSPAKEIAAGDWL
jgi:hypothetical protein